MVKAWKVLIDTEDPKLVSKLSRNLSMFALNLPTKSKMSVEPMRIRKPTVKTTSTKKTSKK